MKRVKHEACSRAILKGRATVRRSGLRGLSSLAIVSVFWVVPRLHGQQSKPTEYDVEATYLYQFGKFVQWPANTSKGAGTSSFPICVLGKDPFGETLDSTIKGESIGGKPIVAERLAKPQDAGGCRVLFISSSESAELDKILKALQRTPVLTVSAMPNFYKRGGMIGFVLRDSRVRFEVNFTAARKAGLTPNSQLLKVAIGVIGKPRAEE